MIDFASEFSLRVGEMVKVGDREQSGSIEAIRVISGANLVEEYSGSPKDVVVTVQVGDGTVNKRGVDIHPMVKKLAV